MKNIILVGIILFCVNAQAASIEELEKIVKELQDKVETLEYDSFERFLQVSGQLEVRYDALSIKTDRDDNQTSFQKSKDSSNFWRTWMQLDTVSKPNDKLSVYTRLQAAKFLNNEGTAATVVTPEDFQRGQTETELAQPFFTRFFANYKFTGNDIFTIGRLPTANGSPYHIKRGESQDGQYPLYAYNMILDGVAYTRVQKFENEKSLSLRAIYMPWTYMRNGAKVTTSTGKEIDYNQNIYSFMAEYNDLSSSWTRNYRVIFQYLRSKNLYFNLNELTNVGADSGNQSDLTIDFEKLVLNFEAYRLFSSNFDFGLQVATNKMGQDGGFDFPDGMGGVTELGFYTNDPDETTSGTFLSGWLRYNFNQSNKIALLFAKSTGGTFVNDYMNRDSVSIYDDHVTGFHLVWNKEFDEFVQLNIGYIQTKKDKNSPVSDLIGETKDVDITREAIYSSFIVNF